MTIARIKTRIDNRNDEMRAAWWEFHCEHPEVGAMVIERANKWRSEGRDHGAIVEVIEYIRLCTPFGDDQVDAFKLNNNHHAFYARWYNRLHPDNDGFFKVRRQTSKDDAPHGGAPLTPADFPPDPHAVHAARDRRYGPGNRPGGPEQGSLF